MRSRFVSVSFVRPVFAHGATRRSTFVADAGGNPFPQVRLAARPVTRRQPRGFWKVSASPTDPRRSTPQSNRGERSEVSRHRPRLIWEGGGITIEGVCGSGSAMEILLVMVRVAVESFDAQRGPATCASAFPIGERFGSEWQRANRFSQSFASESREATRPCSNPPWFACCAVLCCAASVVFEAPENEAMGWLQSMEPFGADWTPNHAALSPKACFLPRPPPPGGGGGGSDEVAAQGLPNDFV
jgi:hypothetical protein